MIGVLKSMVLSHPKETYILRPIMHKKVRPAFGWIKTMQASPQTLVFYAFIYQYKALLINNYNIMFARLTDICKQVWLI